MLDLSTTVYMPIEVLSTAPVRTAGAYRRIRWALVLPMLRNGSPLSVLRQSNGLYRADESLVSERVGPVFDWQIVAPLDHLVVRREGGGRMRYLSSALNFGIPSVGRPQCEAFHTAETTFLPQSEKLARPARAGGLVCHGSL